MTHQLRRMAYLGVLLAMAIAAALTEAIAGPEIDPKAGKTLVNLQAAYNGESNARLRYVAYANRAYVEGYGQVASLFRAAAEAEEIHMRNHAEVIRKMGAEPYTILEMPLLRSTKENLEYAADQGEAYERDTMYPEFIKQAQAESNEDAVRTFDLARKAEAQHFRLFTEALGNLENMKGKSHPYYVCTACGYTTAEPPTGDCVSCSSASEKYQAVD